MSESSSTGLHLVTHYVYLSPKFDGMPIAKPVYQIDNNYYEVTSLRSSHYSKWHEEALFGIPIDLGREWKTSPILVETKCGGLIVEATDAGRLALGYPSTKRALDSPIIELHKMLVPKLDTSKRNRTFLARRLPPPDQIGWEILKELVKFGLTLNEYLGRSSVKEGGTKMSYCSIVKMWEKQYVQRFEKIPIFMDPKRYEECNVIIRVTDNACNVSGTIGQYFPVERQCQEPTMMVIDRF